MLTLNLKLNLKLSFFHFFARRTSQTGTSTEIYLYGTQYCFIFISIILSAFIMHHTIIPVFHELQITSTYEVFY